MKRLILVILLLWMVGCAGGSGGGNDGDDNGTAPDILSVEFYQYVDGIRVVKTTFVIDEVFSMQMIADDPDRDMKKYFVEISGNGISEQRNRDIPPAATDTVEIYDYQNNVYDYFYDQFGTYSVCFWIVDGDGHESDDYCVMVTVTDYQAL